VHIPLFLGLLFLGSSLLAQSAQTLEAQTSAFDFDNFRRNPIQSRQTHASWVSKNNQELQRDRIASPEPRRNPIGERADALFPDQKKIPLAPKPEKLPTPSQLTDRVTFETYGETSKGPRDLLARGRVVDQLGLANMTDTDYEIYVEQQRAAAAIHSDRIQEAELQPMPTLINTKTGGPPHGYAVSQAGVGSRREPRNGQNPFEDLLSSLRLEQPLTKGSDPLPAPSARLVVPGDSDPREPVSSLSGGATNRQEATP